MIRKRKRTDDDIGPSTGIIKWVNKFFRFVLYPFIHPWYFAVIVAGAVMMMVVLPLYLGVKVEDIPAWYYRLYQERSRVANDIVKKAEWNDFHKTIVEALKNVDKKVEDYSHNVKNTGRKVLVDYDVEKVYKHHNFGQAVENNLKDPMEPSRDDFYKEIVERPILPRRQITEKNNPRNVVFKPNPELELIYLSDPEKISGRAHVFNANEIEVGDQLVFLYGIYTVTRSPAGDAAEKYLRDMIEGKDIDCVIGALSIDKIATAVCFYDNINLNQQLVDLGFAADVNLN